MNAMMRKEMRLTALLLTYLFIGFAVMTLLPGYPILCGTFFICLGIFQTFQSAREANDIVFVPQDDVTKWNTIIRKLLPTLQFVNMLAGPFGSTLVGYFNF